MPFAFTPETGLMDHTAFPTVPPSEETYREQFNRLHMQTKDYINLLELGWITVVEAWIYASVSGIFATVTVPTGALNRYQPGDRVMLTQNSTVKKFYIVGVTDTTVVLTGGTDFVLTGSAISQIYVSKCSNPQGFPEWMNYTPTLSGFSGSPTATSPKFAIVGRSCCLSIMQIDGTSNSTGLSFTAPLAIAEGVTNPTVLGFCAVRDNGTLSATLGHIGTSANSNVFQCYRAFYQTLWTGSGQKSVWFPPIWYAYKSP